VNFLFIVSFIVSENYHQDRLVSKMTCYYIIEWDVKLCLLIHSLMSTSGLCTCVQLFLSLSSA